MTVRRILLEDAVAVARALMEEESCARSRLLARIFRERRLAERHVVRTGRNHPDFGDGSLLSAALGHRCAREPGLDDATFRSCLILVLEALSAGAKAGQFKSVRRSPRIS